MKPQYLLLTSLLAFSTHAYADVIALYANTNVASTAASSTAVSSQVNGAAPVTGVTAGAIAGSGLNANGTQFFLRNQFGASLWVSGSSPTAAGPASSDLWLGVNNQNWGAVASPVSSAHYLEFTVTADTGLTLDMANLTFDWQAGINNQTNTANFGYQLFASKDGGAYAPVGTAGSKLVGNALGASTDWGAISNENIDLNSLDGANTVTFRLAMNNPLNTTAGSYVQFLRNIMVNGVVIFGDSDDDGLPDAWEQTIISHAAGQIPPVIVTLADIKGPFDAPSTSDYDLDGSSDSAEHVAVTNPTDSDSDDDNLPDGVETGTGVWAGMLDRGTSPKDSDTDDDGLADDKENNSGIWVALNNTGTDPLRADTDGDGFSDYAETNDGTTIDLISPGTNPNLEDTDGDTIYDRLEIRAGTNPFQSSSKLAPGDLAMIGADDFTYTDGAFSSQNGGSGFDFDNNPLNDPFVGHTTLKSDWDSHFGSTLAFSGGKLTTSNSGVIREFNGTGEGNAINGDESIGAITPSADSKVVYFRSDITRGAGVTWTGMSSFEFGSERLFFGVPNGVGLSGQREFGIEQSGVGSSFRASSPILPITGQAYTIVAKIDLENDLLSLWVNPDLTKTEAENPVYVTRAYTTDASITRIRLGSGGSSSTPTSWDHVVVARQWSAIGIFPGVAGNDYTAWIGGYPGASGATGFTEDADKDGVVNGVEAYFGTDPSAVSQGLTQSFQSGGVFKFRHTKSNQLPSDVTGSYQWSTDMINWHTSGQTNVGGVTTTVSSVTITDNASPALDEIEVSATVTVGATSKLFVRVLSSQP